jgi:hypothetical protein
MVIARVPFLGYSVFRYVTVVSPYRMSARILHGCQHVRVCRNKEMKRGRKRFEYWPDIGREVFYASRLRELKLRVARGAEMPALA